MKRLSRIASLIAFAAMPARAAAQEPDTSLAARLARAEQMIAVLQQQLAEQAGAGVRTRSGHRLELSGTVLLNGFYNNAKVNSSDLPSFVLPPDPPGSFTISHLGGTARQSELGLSVTVPEVLRASFTGTLELDFYGGHQAQGRLFPIPHLKRTRAELRWPNAWVAVGQDAPLISDVNPSSFAATSIPGFTNAGNLWFWTPQVRAGFEAGGALKVGLEAAALAPVSMDVATTFQPEPSRAERSRRPFTQGRLLVRWETPNSAGEVGVGGHYGWVATSTADSFSVTRAAAATARFTVTQYAEVRAEAFVGEMLSNLGGGGIGQGVGPGETPVRTRGGWAQLNIMPLPEVELGGGFGFDDPDDRDLLLASARLKNLMIEGHLHLKPGPLLLAVEFRRVETTYDAPLGKLFVNHINVATGFRF
jgi:hypothetical protein